MSTDKDSSAATESAADDAGERYADKVNAPVSRKMLEALRAELQSEEYARFRKPRRRERDPKDD